MKKNSFTKKQGSSNRKNTIDLDLFSSGKRDKESLLMSADTGGTPSLTVTSNNKKDKYLNFKKVVYVSMGLMVIFTSCELMGIIGCFVVREMWGEQQVKIWLVDAYYGFGVVGAIFG